MALINCPECNKEISDQAKICPNCGYRNKVKYPKVRKKTILIFLFFVIFASSMIGVLIFSSNQRNLSVSKVKIGSHVNKIKSIENKSKQLYENTYIISDAKLFGTEGQIIISCNNNKVYEKSFSYRVTSNDSNSIENAENKAKQLFKKLSKKAISKYGQPDEDKSSSEEKWYIWNLDEENILMITYIPREIEGETSISTQISYRNNLIMLED